MRLSKDDLIKDLERATDPQRVRREESLAQHCSFRTGGPADLFIEPRTERELAQVMRILHRAQMETFLLGRGTNLLIGDGGYRGAVVSICAGSGAEETADTEIARAQLTGIHIEGTRLLAGAGATLQKAALAARDAGLSGLEFAAGIPGSVGGGVVMNAGAFGGEMKGIVREVRILAPTGEILTKSAEEMAFGYRMSLLKKEPGVVLSVLLELNPGDREQIAGKIMELGAKRREKQPLEFASAGSTFKRPEGYFAGKLIQDAGLRGFRVGDAQVSEKHCGFVINRGSATASEVRSLIEQVQQKVFENSGVRLEREVIFLGEF